MVVHNAGPPKLCSASVPAFSGRAIEVPALQSCQYQPYYGRSVGSVSSPKLSVPALLWSCWYLSVSAPQIVLSLCQLSHSVVFASCARTCIRSVSASTLKQPLPAFFELYGLSASPTNCDMPVHQALNIPTDRDLPAHQTLLG